MERRTFLQGLAAVLGLRATRVAPVSAAPSSTGLRVDAAIIEAVGDSTLTVRSDSGTVSELRARDFPPDWEFEPGDRVSIWHDHPEEGVAVLIPHILKFGPAYPHFIGDDEVAFGRTIGKINNDSVRAQIADAIEHPDSSHPAGYLGSFVKNEYTGQLRAFGLLRPPLTRAP